MKYIFITLIILISSCLGMKENIKKVAYVESYLPTGYILEIPNSLELESFIKGEFYLYLYRNRDDSYFYISYEGFFYPENYGLNNNIRYYNKDSLNNLMFVNKSNFDKISNGFEISGIDSNGLYWKDVFIKSKNNYDSITYAYKGGVFIGYINVEKSNVEKFEKIIQSVIEINKKDIDTNIIIKFP